MCRRSVQPAPPCTLAAAGIIAHICLTKGRGLCAGRCHRCKHVWVQVWSGTKTVLNPSLKTIKLTQRLEEKAVTGPESCALGPGGWWPGGSGGDGCFS